MIQLIQVVLFCEKHDRFVMADQTGPEIYYAECGCLIECRIITRLVK